MERRRETRFEADQTILVTILGTQDIQVTAKLTELSGQGLSLQAEQAIPAGSAVRIDLADNIYLGEVCHCSRQGEGFQAGIQLEQSLTGVSDLSRLLHSLLWESRPVTPVVASAKPAASEAMCLVARAS